MVEDKQKLSKVQCLGCGMVLTSQHIHDFQHCNCTNHTFVDSGAEYFRYGGKEMSKILFFDSDGSSHNADMQMH
jgi:hypothetical protein